MQILLLEEPWNSPPEPAPANTFPLPETIPFPLPCPKKEFENPVVKLKPDPLNPQLLYPVVITGNVPAPKAEFAVPVIVRFPELAPNMVFAFVSVNCRVENLCVTSSVNKTDDPA